MTFDSLQSFDSALNRLIDTGKWAQDFRQQAWAGGMNDHDDHVRGVFELHGRFGVAQQTDDGFGVPGIAGVSALCGHLTGNVTGNRMNNRSTLQHHKRLCSEQQDHQHQNRAYSHNGHAYAGLVPAPRGGEALKPSDHLGLVGDRSEC